MPIESSTGSLRFGTSEFVFGIENAKGHAGRNLVFDEVGCWAQAIENPFGSVLGIDKWPYRAVVHVAVKQDGLSPFDMILCQLTDFIARRQV